MCIIHIEHRNNCVITTNFSEGKIISTVSTFLSFFLPYLKPILVYTISKKRLPLYIHGFWVSYGLIKIKVPKSSPPVTITQDVDLENKFAGNSLLKDNSDDWDDSNKLQLINVVFFIQLPLLKKTKQSQRVVGHCHNITSA